MKKLVVLVLLVIGMAGWAQSQSIDGTGQWLHDCWLGYQKVHNQTATIEDIVSGYEYTDFVVGAATVMCDAGWLNPSGTTHGQWFAVVGKYLDANPEQWNQDAQVLVYWALYAAWPGKTAAPYW